MTAAGLRVLVVDDELPALEELAYLLRRDDRVAEVATAGSGTDALRRLEQGGVDAVFLDIAMPGLSGLELARVLARFKTQTPIVFVTAHEDHAVDAFELRAVDYLLKPVRDDRLHEAVRRVVDAVTDRGPQAGDRDETIAVELGGVTRFVARSEVRYVEAQGDYARLHTGAGSHLVRVPLTTLEERWRDAGFLRIHRSLLVSSQHIREVRMDSGRCTVRVGDAELQVARRHTRALRDVLVRQAKPSKT
ncbi:MAG: LytTR family DNA-binding domain-containing protein [Actinomycetota bacterium]|nr:LytTR family DNA-binding domain-containing protein [Actinomycetota bacterium]